MKYDITVKRYLLVVGPFAENMGSTVDQTRTVKCKEVTQHVADVPRNLEIFVPEVPRYESWNGKSNNWS